jgi:hypothetical protein
VFTNVQFVALTVIVAIVPKPLLPVMVSVPFGRPSPLTPVIFVVYVTDCAVPYAEVVGLVVSVVADPTRSLTTSVVVPDDPL